MAKTEKGHGNGVNVIFPARAWSSHCLFPFAFASKASLGSLS